MWFFQAIATGFAITIGIELALGLCNAISVIRKGNRRR